MNLEDRLLKRTLGRKPEGMAACLLPFEEDGSIARGRVSDCDTANGGGGVKMCRQYGYWLCQLPLK